MFKNKPLKELLVKKGYIRGPFGSSLIRNDLINKGPYVVYEQAQAISGSRNFRFFISKEKFLEMKRFEVKKNDLIISCSGTVGRISTIHKTDPPGIISQALLMLRPDPTKILPEYLKWFFKTRQGFNELINASHGSVQQNIAPRAIVESIDIPTPNISTQKAITQILENFENYIELNHKMSQNLEEIAKTLFKSWFIDFDPVRTKLERRPTRLSKKISDLFPNSFENSELGEIPKGWDVKPFREVIDVYIDNRGKTPPLEKEGIPLIEVKHINSKSLFPNLKTDKYVSTKTYNTWFRKHVKKNDILISTVGTIGLTSLIFDTNLTIAQNILGLRFGNFESSYYMFYLIKHKYFQNQVESRLVETVQKSIKRKDLDTILILVPNKKILKIYREQVESLIDRQFVYEKESNTLRQIREILLPKFISGELRIPDVEKLVEKVGV